MSFKFIDHTADIAVEVTGNSLEELFVDSAMAWRQSVVNKGLMSSGNVQKLELSNVLPEALLVNFLNELNYLLFTKKWLMNSVVAIKIKKDALSWNLEAKILGEKYSHSRHSFKEEIKAVTFHQMNIKEKGGEYKTRIVFDI